MIINLQGMHDTSLQGVHSFLHASVEDETLFSTFLIGVDEEIARGVKRRRAGPILRWGTQPSETFVKTPEFRNSELLDMRGGSGEPAHTHRRLSGKS